MELESEGASTDVTDLEHNQPTTLRLGLQPAQWVLAGLLMAILGGLVYNSLHTAETRAADALFRLTSETSAANVIYTQREAMNYGLVVERWMGQGASRREVQIARALLQQRLNVVDDRGLPSAGHTTQEFMDALVRLDRLVASQPPGFLTEEQDQIVRAEGQEALDTFLSAVRPMLVEYQRQADNGYRALTLARSNSDRTAAFLLTFFFVGTVIFIIWVYISTSRNYRRARQRIADDAHALEAAQVAIELANAIERGQAKILERIARGAPLDVVYRLVVDLAHVAIGGHLRIDTDADEVIACCGSKPKGATWMTRFGSSTDERIRTITLHLDIDGMPDADQIALTRRCADLATIAIERHASETRLRVQASFDSLTGLANRTLLVSRLESALHRRSRSGHVAVLFCDLDRFKQVNDTMGHDTGDLLLVEAAERLLQVVRQTDTVARIGGDEFVLLLEGLDGPRAAEELAKRCQAVLSEPFNVGGAEVYVDVSIGIAHATPGQDITASDMIRDADVAMYWAKRSDSQRWASFDARLQAAARERLQMDTALRHAIARDEFRVFFQPIVDLKSRQVEGFEALIRWQHPELGLLEPADFLPVAEAVGLVSEISDWVLQQAISAMAAWRVAGRHADACVTVNVSGRQLRDSGFRDRVSELLTGAGVSADSLVLEVTEDLLVTDQVSKQVLSDLRSFGVRIALDDFGTGHSSLTQLQSLEVDILKLDRRFVEPLSQGSERDVAVLRSVLQLAEALSLDLVIEGIESEFECQKLIELGATQGQGFIFGVPMPEVSIPSQPSPTAVRNAAVS
jgi:diguanylate cyclase (GGDEF)-like protein